MPHYTESQLEVLRNCEAAGYDLGPAERRALKRARQRALTGKKQFADRPAGKTLLAVTTTIAVGGAAVGVFLAVALAVFLIVLMERLIS